MIRLVRACSGPSGTYGVLSRDGIPLCDTAELQWLDNHPQTSCIPAGIYDVEAFMSPSKGDVWLVRNVPNRSMIEIHVANYPSQLLGCIAVGHGFLKDPVGIALSHVAFTQLKNTLPSNFQLQIINAF